MDLIDFLILATWSQCGAEQEEDPRAEAIPSFTSDASHKSQVVVLVPEYKSGPPLLGIPLTCPSGTLESVKHLLLFSCIL